MRFISCENIDYDNVAALEEVFISNGLSAKAKDSDGCGNARVDLVFASRKYDEDLEVTVMVWVVPRQPELLHFRSVIFDKAKRDSFKKTHVLWKEIEENSEMLNQGGFGKLSLSNMVGITTDYFLTMEGGIAESTLCNTAKEVSRFAQGVKKMIADAIEDYKG
jgi:hypothetical protein